MDTISHHGHLQFADEQLGATLRLELGQVTLDVATAGHMPAMPERLDIAKFTSNTGYFTLINLIRRNRNIRIGVGELSTYRGGLAFESALFSTQEEIRTQTWSMHIGDIAKILHVNGVSQQVSLPDRGRSVITYSVSPASPVALDCPVAGIAVRLRQNIQAGGNIIDGPTLKLTYPVDITFAEELDVERAFRSMSRIRQLFSLVMGRVLPISSVSMKLTLEGEAHEVGIYGLPSTDVSEEPARPIFSAKTAEILAPLLDRWLTRYDELKEAIRLHMSGLEQRKLPIALRLQIFVQALEALHRRTSSTVAAEIDSAPIVASLRAHGIPGDVIDRVTGVLAHAHEPGLRQRLRQYWDLFEEEIADLRPLETRKAFINRVVATRNHYAHRTDADDQVLTGVDLWDATETLKAMSHMALLREAGADTVGLGRSMFDQRFVAYAIRE